VARRVLHVLGDAGQRGAAQRTIVAALASTLDAERYELCAWYLNGESADLTPIAGVRSDVVAFGGGGDVVGALRFAGRVAVLRPQIVHLHVGGRSRTRLLRALTSARLVAHLHAAAGDDGRPLRLERFARSADAVLATSHAVADLAGVPATVVHPGVRIPEPPPPRRASGDTPTIGVVARLEPVKGIDTLLHAAAALRARRPGFRLQIAGSGSAQAQLVALRDRLRLENVVEFLGWRDDLARLHAGWDVFALPSRHEGFGLAALEAMAAGLPVVASRTGGVPELVVDGETGVLVEPADVAGLAAGLERLIADPTLRAGMGAAARNRAEEHFGAARMGDAVASVYDALLAGDREG
jgi:glycosyltransferase involved in cell wall biosynthesis